MPTPTLKNLAELAGMTEKELTLLVEIITDEYSLDGDKSETRIALALIAARVEGLKESLKICREYSEHLGDTVGARIAISNRISQLSAALKDGKWEE